MSKQSSTSGVTVVVLVGSALLVLGISSPVPHEAGRDTSPKAVVARAEKNLGLLSQGEVREVCFRVRNSGGRRLVITSADPACCGQAEEPASFVAVPGDSVEIRVQVNTNRWYGEMREIFSYTTNDPRLPRLEFTVFGQVVARDVAASFRH